MIYSSINQIVIEPHLTKKSDATKAAEKAYVIGCRKTHIFVQNVLTLSVIIALGGVKPNADWISVTMCMSLVLKKFHKVPIARLQKDMIHLERRPKLLQMAQPLKHRQSDSD